MNLNMLMILDLMKKQLLINIKINSGEVYAAGYSIGDTAYKAAKKALDEHSPSKKMKKVGAFAID